MLVTYVQIINRIYKAKASVNDGCVHAKDYF